MTTEKRSKNTILTNGHPLTTAALERFRAWNVAVQVSAGALDDPRNHRPHCR